MDSILSLVRCLAAKTISVGIVAMLALSLALASSCAFVTTKQMNIEHAYGLTPEGWWIIYTNDQIEIASMCEDVLDTRVVGCSRWPVITPEVYPVKHCLIGIYTGDPNEPVYEILDHELRHCREGAWHKEVK